MYFCRNVSSTYNCFPAFPLLSFLVLFWYLVFTEEEVSVDLNNAMTITGEPGGTFYHQINE